MKRAIFTIALALCFYAVNAQNLINGVVTNKQNKVLSGATIKLKPGDYETISNGGGKFVFNNVKSGEYKLLVNYLGYAPYQEKIVVDGNKSLSIQLEERVFQTDEIIVSSTRANEKTPAAFQNISAEELRKAQPAQDITYMLDLTPSVVTSSESGIGTGYTGLRIRGSDPTRINITVNGVPLNDSESQGVYFVNMPDFVSSVDNVQIQRGVGTSTNGSGAFGATINFKTEGISNDPYAEIESYAGSFNTYKNSIKAGTGLIHDYFSFDARVSKVTSDGYIDYAFSDHESMFVSGAFRNKNTIVQANIIYGNQRTGISWWGVPKDSLETNRTFNPAGQYTDMYGNPQYYEDQTDNYTQTHYQLHIAHQFNDKWKANGALHYTKGKGYYEQYKESDDLTAYGLPPIQVGDTIMQIGDVSIYAPDSTITTSDIVRQKWLNNDFYGFTYATNYNGELFSVTIGGAWNKYDGDHFGNIVWSEFTSLNEHDYQWYFNLGEKTDFNSYGKITFNIADQLSAFGDIQYRYIDYKISGTDDNLQELNQHHNWNFINPKAGLTYQPNKKINTYFMFAMANREPTRSDLKAALHDNDALPEAETMYDFELGGQYRTSKLAFGANLYAMLYDNQLVSTGEKSAVGYDIKTNVDESYRIGIELTAGWQFLPQWKIDANATFSRNKINNFVEYVDAYDSDWNPDGQIVRELGTTDISYSPNIIAAGLITYKPIDKLSFTWTTKFVDEQFIDNTSSDERKIEAYTFSNFIIRYQPPFSFTDRTELICSFNNVFNTKYENNAYGGHYMVRAANPGDQPADYTWSYYFPQAGINFMAGVNLKF